MTQADVESGGFAPLHFVSHLHRDQRCAVIDLIAFLNGEGRPEAILSREWPACVQIGGKLGEKGIASLSLGLAGYHPVAQAEIQAQSIRGHVANRDGRDDIRTLSGSDAGARNPEQTVEIPVRVIQRAHAPLQFRRSLRLIAEVAEGESFRVSFQTGTDLPGLAELVGAFEIDVPGSCAMGIASVADLKGSGECGTGICRLLF